MPALAGQNRLWQACFLATVACTGAIGPEAGAPPSPSKSGGGVTAPSGPRGETPAAQTPAPPPPASSVIASFAGLRQLSPAEYDATLRDLLDDRTAAGAQRLPDPALSRELPFSNDAASKSSTDVLVGTAEDLAWAAATRATANPDLVRRLVPCTPTGAGDATCLRTFITRFGRRVVRRPLSEAEVQGYLSLQKYAVERKSFNEGVRLVIAALLQQPDFIYRVEKGTEVSGSPGLFKLNGFEVATRMSYWLWGSTPSDDLLDLAAAGKLDKPADLVAGARKLLEDPRARDQLFRFHAEWLGLFDATHPLAPAMRDETKALIDEVVFAKNGDYRELLLSDRTFIGDALAEHYGLPKPGKTAWVPWGTSGRAGILSQGAFLSAFAKPEDTSPVNRGMYIAGRLLCRHIPDPPPDVDVNNLPETECRRQMFAAHLNRGSSCFACHQQMDPIGFGLENYDRTGKFRTHENGRPNCAIDGVGEISGIGKYKGPGELSRLIADAPEFDRCLVTHVYQFASGRHLDGADDEKVVDALTTAYKTGGRKLINLLLAVVAEPSFAYRNTAATPGK